MTRTLEMIKDLNVCRWLGKWKVLVPEFFLCKGKEVEESWTFRENKETQQEPGGTEEIKGGKMEQSQVMEEAKVFADN